MWQHLIAKLFGPPPVERQHPFFGRILYMGSDEDDPKGYWEAEKIVEGQAEPLTVLINAPLSGPDDKQVQFYRDAMSDQYELFSRCWPIFEPDFPQWTGKNFNGNWQDDFQLVSIEIPKDGDIHNEWSVSYFVEAANHYFTARFINAKPTFNEIDG